MPVETDGTVRMRGEGSGSDLPVRVHLDAGRMRLMAGDELVGDWEVSEIGIAALHDGFAIRAEGEEFILKAVEDAQLAEELGLASASPRMARKVAALHNPPADEPEPVIDAVAEPKSNVLAIAFALGGVLVLLGGTFLRGAPTSSAAPTALVDSPGQGGADFWIAFVVGGALMVAVAYIMSIGTRGARAMSLVILAGVIGLFGWVISDAVTDASYLTAYGFIAGGLVVGVAVLFSGGLKGSE